MAARVVLLELERRWIGRWRQLAGGARRIELHPDGSGVVVDADGSRRVELEEPPPAGRLVLSEQERHIIELGRHVRKYAASRIRALEDPGLVWIELDATGAGAVVVDACDPNRRAFRAASWRELAEAAEAMARARDAARRRRGEMRARARRRADRRDGVTCH